MIQLSPRSQFRESDSNVRDFGAIARNDLTQKALAAALGEYALAHNPSAEQLAGIRAFLELFLNLAESDKAPPTFPSKHLDYSVVPRTQPPTS